jgi:pilus assembly protein CpaB
LLQATRTDADGLPPGAGIAWLCGAAALDTEPTAPRGDAPTASVQPRTDPGGVGWALPAPGGPGPMGWPGIGSGEVLTWLPDGRWVRACDDRAGDDGWEPQEPDRRATDPRAARRDTAAQETYRPDADLPTDLRDPHLPDTHWRAMDLRVDPGVPQHRDEDRQGGPWHTERERRRGQRRITLARLGAWAAGWPRRAAIGVLLLTAAALSFRPHAAGTTSPAVPSQSVVVAARDLAAGTELAAADLRTVSMPVALVPAGASRRAAGLIGRTAAGPVRRGEALTDARVVGPGLVAGLRPGESAAVPVRLADPDAAALVRAGDRVDVLGTPVDPDGGQATAGGTVEVASAVRVLAVLGSRDPADGVVLVVATTQPVARALAGALARHRLTVTVRPP